MIFRGFEDSENTLEMRNMNASDASGFSMDMMPILSSPNTTVTPSVPVTPATPVTPSVPVTPATPVTPSVPVTPATPVTPSVPVTPAFPTPSIPSVPITPAFPGINWIPDYITPILPNNPNIDITVIPIVPGLTRTAYIRYLNAAPNLGSVDIYINGNLVASNVQYQNFTDYFRAVPGFYRITVYRAGTQSRPVLSTGFTLNRNMIYTAAIKGPNDNIELQLISDRPRSANPNTAYMRFIHLAPNTPDVDVYVDNRLVLSDLAYGEVSNYLTLRPGMHSLQLKLAGTNTQVLNNPQMYLQGGRFYATYVVGTSGRRPGLEVLIPLEGTSYLGF